MRLIEYTGPEPLSLEQFKLWQKADDGEDSVLSQIVIPAARQVAERRSGAAIRPGRYAGEWESLPAGDTALDLGAVRALESVTAAGAAISGAALVWRGREAFVRLPAAARDVRVVVTAGVETEHAPAVLQWIALAAGLAYENREMATTGNVASLLPPGYLDALLDVVRLPPRF